jgi:hypothetical protein
MDGWQTQAVSASATQLAPQWQASVVLPAHNEQEAIGRVLAEIVEVLSGEPIHYEILVVDDGSTDRTASLAEQFALSCWQCPVRVIRCPQRGGAGAARKLGIRQARGEIVVMLDADGSYPPSHPRIARQCKRGPAAGTLPNAARQMADPVGLLPDRAQDPDLNTGLKAFKQEEMLRWLGGAGRVQLRDTMTLAFLTNGYAVKYVPTAYSRGSGRASSIPSR